MIRAAREYFSDLWETWNEFWFAATDPATLSVIRVFAGGMLFYTHLVWTKGLADFFGDRGWLPPSFMTELDVFRMGPVQTRWDWSYFYHIHSATWLWSVHIAALVIFFLLMIGLFSRTMSVLAFFCAVSYANRITPGAYFGLDTINCMLAMYLMVGPCGARYSLDRLWRLRRGAPDRVPPSVSANVAIRLIQIHMCVVYLFSGLGKIRGAEWWEGRAAWWSFANLEYQTLNMTSWLASHPFLINLFTHVTVFGELFYCALIWPRLTRPWMLLLAVMMHGGIIFALGMPTFGLVMIIGNLAFVSPPTVQRVFDPIARRIRLAVLGSEGQGRPAPPSRPAAPTQQPGMPQPVAR